MLVVSILTYMTKVFYHIIDISCWGGSIPARRATEGGPGPPGPLAAASAALQETRCNMQNAQNLPGVHSGCPGQGLIGRPHKRVTTNKSSLSHNKG